MLVARAGALGDLLLLRPVLHALRAAGWAVELMAPAGPMRALETELDGNLAWDAPEVAGLLAGRASPELERRLERFSAALLLSRSPELTRAMQQRLARVERCDPLPPAEYPGHAAAWALQAAARLGADGALRTPPPLAAAGPTPRELRSRLPDRFLALHPGSGSAAKNWPAERFAQLAAALSPGAPWLLVSGPADAVAAASLRSRPGAIEANGLELPRLASLLREAALYVGNDSGVSHLAAATGAPTLTLFGPTDAARWAPLGRRAAVLQSADGRLASIEVSQALAAARRLQGAAQS